MRSKREENLEDQEIKQQIEKLHMKKKKFALRPEGWTNEDEWKFENLWETFPPRRGASGVLRKNGKAYAREVYKGISPGEKLYEKMLAAIKVQKVCEEWTRDNGIWVPDLSRWLNNMRWEDEIIR